MRIIKFTSFVTITVRLSLLLALALGCALPGQARVTLDGGYPFNFKGVDYLGQEFLVHVPGVGNIWVAVRANHDLEASPTTPLLVLDPNPPQGRDVDPSAKPAERPSLRALQDQLYRLLHDPRGATKAARPLLGEIRLWSANVQPPGWIFCDGRLLPIRDFVSLFELIGNTYGGDGRTTFGIPDLRGRVPMGRGAGPGLTNRRLGEEIGTENVVLNESQLPAHSHPLRASNSSATQTRPAGNVLATASTPQYFNAATTVFMSGSSIGNTGLGAPVPNVQPSTVLNYIIAVDASRSRPIFPSAAKWPVTPGFTPPRWKMRLASGPGIRIESDAVTRPPFNNELTEFTSGGVDYHALDFIEYEDGIGTIWLAIPKNHDFAAGPVTPQFVLAPDVVTGKFIPWPDWIDDNGNRVQDEGESWVDVNNNGVRDLPLERITSGGDGRVTWKMGHKLVFIGNVVQKLGMIGWNRGAEFDYFPGPISSTQFLDELDFYDLPNTFQPASTTIDLHASQQFTSAGVIYYGIEMLEHEDGIGTIWIAVPRNHDLEATPETPRIVLAPDEVRSIN